MSGLNHGTAISSARAWDLILAARRLTASWTDGASLALDLDGAVTPMPQAALRDSAVLAREDGRWRLNAPADSEARALFDLYLPLCDAWAERPLTLGHLGQSLDGYIATESGESRHLNGIDNIVHLHRLRALCDAVVVGAGTIAADDPRLTTRLVTGPNPARVVIDPLRRLAGHYQVFTDGLAPTLLVCADSLVPPRAVRWGDTRVIGVPLRGRRLDPLAVLTALHTRGLHSLFIEGGGVTVSDFLQAGLLDRLHLALAPLVIGAGRPGIRLPAALVLADCLRPPFRLYQMGSDVLFDCDLRAGREAGAAADSALPSSVLTRLL